MAETIKKVTKAHVTKNTGNNEWYTPSIYIDMARDVLGSIDIDPASSQEADTVVKAKKYYTAEDDGLSHEWKGKVWMNPPYARVLISGFCKKIVKEFNDGNVTEAIVLINNATETINFQEMLQQATAVCFPKGRMKFWYPGRKIATPLQGQAFFYFGENKDKFISVFKVLGAAICLNQEK